MKMVHDLMSFAIVIISIFSIYVSFQLLKKASGIIKIPFISTFFIFKYLVFAYSGSVLLNVFYFDYEVSVGLYERPDILLSMWYYTTAGLYLIPLGMLIANAATGYKPIKFTKELLSKDIVISNYDKSSLQFMLFLFLFGISILVLVLYISKIEILPISGAFYGLSASDIGFLRSEATNNFDGKYYRYAIFMKTLPLFMLFILFFMKNISLKWKLFFYIMLAYNIFVSIIDTQKAPVIQLFMLLMLSHFYSKNAIDRRVFVITGIILSTLVIVMYMFFMASAERDFFEILALPLNRIFLGQIEPFYYWQLFQEHGGYIYGASFPNPAGIFPFESRKITIEIMEYAHPELAKLGIIGSMPTIFFADWFINFGPLMALFSMVLLGFIMQMTDIVFISKLSKHKSLLFSVLFIYIINYFGKFAGTSFAGIIFDEDWIVPLIVVSFLIIAKQMIKKFVTTCLVANKN